MNTKKLMSLLLVLVVVLGVSVAVNRATAGNWVGPTSAFPACPSDSVMGCNTPVNVGTADQDKSAGLTLAGGLIVSQASRFKDDLYLDNLKGKSYSTGGWPASLDPSLCADNNGKIEACSNGGAQTYTESGVHQNDLGEVTLTLSSQNGNSSNAPSFWSKWSITSNKVLMSNDPSHVANPDTLNIYYSASNSLGSCANDAYIDGSSVSPFKAGEGYMGGTGKYFICLGYSNGNGLLPTYISMNKILSINLLSNSGTGASGFIKLTPVSYSSGTAIGFYTSDDSSANNLAIGDRVVITYLRQGR